SAQSGVWVYGGKLYQVVGLPLLFGDYANEAPSGALILATRWTDQLATELGVSHNCDVAFLSDDSVLACSLSGPARDQLLSSYRHENWPTEVSFALNLSGNAYRASLDPLMDSTSGRRLGAMLILSSQSDEAAIR